MSDGPQHPATPASDTERESTIGLLRQAVVDGRLTLEEFSDRVGREIPARSSYHCLFATIGIRAGGPGGTLYVRNQRERPNRWFKLLGKGDTYA